VSLKGLRADAGRTNIVLVDPLREASSVAQTGTKGTLTKIFVLTMQENDEVRCMAADISQHRFFAKGRNLGRQEEV